MANAQLGLVLRHIRKLADSQVTKDLPDGELLQRYCGHGDESAFAAIVRRYGPLVMRACRHVLRHEQDAEDAFQATFLVLARKASSIRQGGALASWLYGVAYHMAMNAKRSASRRRGHERQARHMAQEKPNADLALRELEALLNEEMERLPEKYRAPLVLCCLDGLSKVEAARRLGWKEGTVSSCLARARKHLQQRLIHRGVTVSTLLGAVAVAQGVTAVRPLLVETTVKAALQYGAGKAVAAGLLSGGATALLQGVTNAMFVTKCKIATALLLALSVAAGAGLLTHQVLAGKNTDAAQPAASKQPGGDSAKADRPRASGKPRPIAAKPEADDTFTVRGRVLDPDGKPCAGAKLYLGYASPKVLTYAVRASSGDDGRFAFSFPKSALDTTREDDPAYQVLAVAAGYGCGWATSNPAAKQDVTLRLVEHAPVKGRIVDAEGQPVAGAKLTVTSVSEAKGASRGWEGPLPGQAEVLTTGADGRFQVAGVGSDRVVNLRLEGRGIATAAVEAQGAAFEYQAALSRPIRGVVRDKDTRKPLAGVSVTCGLCEALTDKDGRYELLGVAKAASYRVFFKPPKGQHYFIRLAGVGDTPGAEVLTADFEMMRGTVVVHGKVTDKATGLPVAGAGIVYWPLYGNDTAAKLRDGSQPRGETIAGADGTYDLPVMPGPGVMLVAGPRPDAYMPAWVTLKEREAFFKTPLRPGDREEGKFEINTGSTTVAWRSVQGYHAVVMLEPGEKEGTLVRHVALERGQQCQVRVVGPDDQPLTGVTVVDQAPETLQGAEFTVRRHNPKGRPRLLTFHHNAKNLAAFCVLEGELPAEKDGPLIVKLQPSSSISGRFVDQDGQPMAGVRGGLWPYPPKDDNPLHGPEFTADKEGRFRVEGLVPGLAYAVIHISKKGIPGYRPRDLEPGTVVEPGMNKDLGDIKRLKVFGDD